MLNGETDSIFLFPISLISWNFLFETVTSSKYFYLCSINLFTKAKGALIVYLRIEQKADDKSVVRYWSDFMLHWNFINSLTITTYFFIHFQRVDNAYERQNKLVESSWRNNTFRMNSDKFSGSLSEATAIWNFCCYLPVFVSFVFICSVKEAEMNTTPISNWHFLSEWAAQRTLRKKKKPQRNCIRQTCNEDNDYLSMEL